MIVDEIDTTDQMLTDLSRRGSTAIKILLTGLILVVLGLGATTGVLINNAVTEQHRINDAVISKTDQLCNFFALIAPLPVQSNSSKVGVELVADSGIAYEGLGCAIKLPPPSAELVTLARKYDVTLWKS